MISCVLYSNCCTYITLNLAWNLEVYICIVVVILQERNGVVRLLDMAVHVSSLQHPSSSVAIVSDYSRESVRFNSLLDPATFLIHFSLASAVDGYIVVCFPMVLYQFAVFWRLCLYSTVRSSGGGPWPASYRPYSGQINLSLHTVYIVYCIAGNSGGNYVYICVT